MSATSILAHLTLGYRHLWGRQRQAAAIELYVDTAPGAAGVDARHLLSTLADLWPGHAPPLLLNVRDPGLLRDTLVHAPADGPWISVPQSALAHDVLRQQVLRAHGRGVPLVWHGGRGQQPAADVAGCFPRAVFSFNESQAVQALRVLRSQLAQPSGAPAADAPLPPGQILQGAPSRLLADWALDRQQAWAIAGWPVDDVLQPGRFVAAPAREVINQLLRAIDDDVSLERLEEQVCAEPVLTYRFLCHVNTLAHKLRGQVDTVRQGLLVWGLTNVRAWLEGQMAQAHDDLDQRPVRLLMAHRAHLVEHLLDPGDEDELRRELYLCGLLADADRLLGEPLATVLARLPLSQRILQGLLEHSGPYYPALQLARALESPDTRVIHALCDSYGFDLEEVNRALLHTLLIPFL